MFNDLKTDVYLSLNGDVIPNHGYLMISDININTALLCNTNYRIYHSGDWFAPDGTRVYNGGVPGFTTSTGSTAVRLWRTTITPADGIYWCSILDAASTLQTVYVGLYNSQGGMYRVLNSLIMELLFSFFIRQAVVS